ncbi:MAG TPA: hypothetical protein VD835_14695 [Pyrinomonadaceae bacterium]|nr:hypothetical protein [Pyrinomonadaceae bacterium]
MTESDFTKNTVTDQGHHHGTTAPKTHSDDGTNHDTESTHEGDEHNHQKDGQATERNITMKNRVTQTLAGCALSIMFVLSFTIGTNAVSEIGDTSNTASNIMTGATGGLDGVAATTVLDDCTFSNLATVTVFNTNFGNDPTSVTTRFFDATGSNVATAENTSIAATFTGTRFLGETPSGFTTDTITGYTATDTSGFFDGTFSSGSTA